jgi:GxxExxY protein
MNIPDRHSVNNLKHSELTGLILKSFYDVYSTLGFGFLESVYHQAMMIELDLNGLNARSEVAIDVHFRDRIVGRFSADIVVENLVILELKAASDLIPAHKTQLLNYLKASQYEIGLLLNFGKRPDFKRLIHDPDTQ